MKPNYSFNNLFRLSLPKVVLALVLGSIALTPSTTHAGEQVPFKASWHATITTSPLVPPLVSVSGIGEGNATQLGRMTAQSVEEIVNLATGEGAASYKFIAANGDELHLQFAFIALPASPTLFAIQGTWQITGGTGRFTYSTGTGAYTGTVEFTGPETAVGSFVACGTMSSLGRTP
jgi:hypothetical protein